MSIKAKIESLNHQGKGIARHNGKVVFIDNALTSEDVIVEITEDKKRYSNARVIKYNSFSDERASVSCPYYDICGGCNISHMDYDSQLNFKKDKLENILSKYSDIKINPIIIKSKEEFYYRNKISLKIIDNKWGYYKNNTHDLVEINHCMIASKSINKIIEHKNLFDIINGEIIIRSNYKDEILIIITSESKVDYNLQELKQLSNIKGIIINNKVMHGTNHFFEKIKEYNFKVNYKSFFQINNYILEKVEEIINNNKYKTVVDLYCGVGVLGTFINSNKLYGIEISKGVNDAQHNAIINNIENAKYIQGDSGKIKEINENIDLLIIDPPRKGIDKNTMNNIIDNKPENIIYMSCNPITLANNLNDLKEHYEIKETYMVDMFPQTYHVESIVIMKKS